MNILSMIDASGSGGGSLFTYGPMLDIGIGDGGGNNGSNTGFGNNTSGGSGSGGALMQKM
ncbi:MAG: hypothetical protein C4329_09315 [Chitinophagaceae bacterium]